MCTQHQHFHIGKDPLALRRALPGRATMGALNPASRDFWMDNWRGFDGVAVVNHDLLHKGQLVFEHGQAAHSALETSIALAVRVLVNTHRVLLVRQPSQSFVYVDTDS
jgi:hypothetical protein